MPMPMEIQHASAVFERFLEDAREQASLTTRNQTYTMTQGVLTVFRRRLDVRNAIRFTGVLPPVLRAIFVADWNLDEPRLPFGERSEMTKEAQSLRKNHNFSPETCIRDVAVALRKTIDQHAFDKVLDEMPEGAKEFWEI